MSAAGLVLAALACRPESPQGFTLLFLRRSPAAVIDGRSWAPDPDKSRLVAFDRRLGVDRTITSDRLNAPVAVAALGSRLLVTELTGEGVVLETDGTVVREWESQLPVALYAASGDRIVAVRSPYRVPGLFNELADAPLFRVLDTLGRPTEGLGAIRVVPFLAEVVNAGAIAVGAGGEVYFGALTRDEIIAVRANGRTAWTTKRGLYPVETDPAYLPAQGRDLPIRRALATIALTLGPDGRLYALGARDSNATLLRLDVLDTASGRIVATRELGPRETAIALAPDGTIRAFDADSLLGSAASGVDDRELFGPAFALPNLAGDTVMLARFAGRVTLVNFWASWCDPCREEFPHMATLYSEFARGDFEIVAISDDVDRGKMLAFVDAFHPPFPILVGAGRMRATYHYRGLPYSLLLDRKGRIIERIFGFGGMAEFHRLHQTIAKEIAVP